MNDNIFLLSIEEYEKYKERIPQINCWWWLRSKGDYSVYVASVNYDGSICYAGDDASGNDHGVRPALKIPYSEEREIGRRLIIFDFPWITIDKDLAIAEVPIAFRRFDKKSNNYEKSEIRQFLLDWMESR